MDNRTKIADYIESRGSRYNEFADEIWGYAETAFREHKSMEAQIRLLEEEGFKVTRNVGDVASSTPWPDSARKPASARKTPKSPAPTATAAGTTCSASPRSPRQPR